MKTRIINLIIILVLSALLLTACSKSETASLTELKTHTIFRYGTVEKLPLRILRHENRNTVLFSDFERSYSMIAKGYADDWGNERILYEADPGCIIENFTANDRYIAWFERREGSSDTNTYTLFLYDTENDDRKLLLEKRIDFKDFEAQSTDLGLYGDTLYYLNYNYVDNTSDIMAYDIVSGTSLSIASIPFSKREEYMRHSISFFAVRDNWLFFNIAGDEQYLTIYDLSTFIPQSEMNSRTTELPKDIDYVLSGDFDPVSKNFALYLRTDSGSIEIVMFSEESQSLTEIYGLEDSEMLNRDMLTLDSNHVYYVIRKNSRENISEHYKGYVYDRKTAVTQKASRCFSLEAYDGKIYGLTFDRNPLNKGIGYMEYEFDGNSE